MTVEESGCSIQHLHFDSVPAMLDYFKTNSIPLESFWLNDDVKLNVYIDRQASDAFRTTNILNVEQLNRVPPRRSRSLHLAMSCSTATSASSGGGGGGGGGSGGSSHPGTPLAGMEARGSLVRLCLHQFPAHVGLEADLQVSALLQCSAGSVGRVVQRSHSHNAGSIQSTGRGGGGGGGGANSHGGSATLTQRSNRENAYVWRNY